MLTSQLKRFSKHNPPKRPSAFGKFNALTSLNDFLESQRMNMKEILGLPAAKLQRIVALKTQIERLQSQLEALATNTSPVAAKKAPHKKRTMSAAARKKISQAAKARWAKVRAGKSK